MKKIRLILAALGLSFALIMGFNNCSPSNTTSSGGAPGDPVAASSPSPTATPVSAAPVVATKISFSGIGSKGIGDPSVAIDANTSRVWMSYSSVDASPMWPTQNLFVESTHIAYSDDQGATWKDTGTVVNAFQDVTLPQAAPNNAGTWVNEVSQLIYDPGAATNQHDKLVWQHYLNVNNSGQFNHSVLSIKMADSPANLAAATELRLFSGYLYDSTGMPGTGTPIALDTAYSTDLNTCIFTEPGMYATATALYLSATCNRISDSESLVFLMKCASPCNPTATAAWTYLGTMFKKADATAAGFDSGFTASGLFKGTDGTQYISVTPQQTSGAPHVNYYSGCYVYKFTNLDTATVDKAAPVKIITGTTGSFNGACNFSTAANKAGLFYLEANNNIPDLFQMFSSGIGF